VARTVKLENEGATWGFCFPVLVERRRRTAAEDLELNSLAGGGIWERVRN
jgi:hypothetical protein